MTNRRGRRPVEVTVDVDAELARLSDFQRATARHAFTRLFGDGADSTSRFLVADEVGLGKTLVARGVITQAIAHLQEQGDDRVDIVYICSNQAIARQNLNKLAPQGVTQYETSERLSMLPFTLSQQTHAPVNLIALTPGTSLVLGTSGGQLRERAAIFRALGEIWRGWRLRGSGMGAVFAGHHLGAGSYDSVDERFRAEAEQFRGVLSDEGRRLFREQIRLLDIRRGGSVQDTLRKLAREYRKTPHNELPDEVKQRRNEVMRDLREAMATTGAQLLQPDLIVLDEFQRFRDVLQSSNVDDDVSAAEAYAAGIAERLFSYHHKDHKRDTRVFLLSATPYAMHTTAADSADGDEHYRDFLQTYEFLAEGCPGSNAPELTEQLAQSLSELRRTILDASNGGAEPAKRAAEAVSKQLRKVMVRTERLSATADRDGMLTEIDETVSVPDDSSLLQYLKTAELVQKLWPATETTAAPIGSVVNYWKAAPYTLSFLDGYKVLPAADDLERASSDLARSHAVLPWKSILDYREVPAAHAGLNKLWQDFFERAHAERLLWLPPSLPYYRVDGDFGSHAARNLTKRLIFSSWKLVPTAVSTLTSYECERRLHDQAEDSGRDKRERSYIDPPTTRPLQFRQHTESMANLFFEMVFPRLADRLDPLALSIELRTSGGTEPSLAEILQHAARIVTEELGRTRAAVPTESDHGHGSTSWYPLAALLIDDSDFDLLTRTSDQQTSSEPAADDETETASALKEDPSYLEEHIDKLFEEALSTNPHAQLPHDVAETVALAAIAAPPMVMYRSLKRSFPDVDDENLIPAARHAAGAVRNLFNRPNGQRAVTAIDAGDPLLSGTEFWRRALQYCAAGNLQSVMDEYVAALIENQGINRIEDHELAVNQTAQAIRTVISMRTTAYQPSTVAGDPDTPEAPPTWRKVRMRTDFAVPLVVEGSQGDGHRRSANDISAAFNSPFWPFVLTSTSVGQEGLDFHLYSHAITHWNLPTNPVDLEQREGRVHRYKGHAIRKNVARAGTFPTETSDPWKELFRQARESRPDGSTDMVPYWVFAPESLNGDRARIERHMPIAPYTREQVIRENLLASVSTYRMAFGQPRQDEFLRYALSRVEGPLREELAAIRIDLTPEAPDRPGH